MDVAVNWFWERLDSFTVGLLAASVLFDIFMVVMMLYLRLDQWLQHLYSLLNNQNMLR